MSFLDSITVLILTFNEAPNIARTLDGVAWARRIVVADSGSTDETIDVVRAHPQAEIFVRSFDNHEAQWNFGLEKCGADADWILALDADYHLDAHFRSELAALSPHDDVSGYRASFRYCIFGRPLSGNLYPPVTVLYRRARARYAQSGHTQRLVTAGRIDALQHRIDHDDRKSLQRWMASQQKYAKLEADHLLAAARAELRRSDRIRLMGWPAPFMVFFYTLIIKRCILDGWPGWFYVLQRTLAETMVALEVVDRRLRPSRSTAR
jgi:glycosyltransferase involved in cell wall biosynthesis